jgi:hypothetical protein
MSDIGSSNTPQVPRLFASGYPTAMAPSAVHSAEAEKPQVAAPKIMNHCVPYTELQYRAAQYGT